MKIDMKPFPLCDLKGTWNEMGRQYGEDMSEEVAHMAGWWESILYAVWPDMDFRLGLHGAIAMYESALATYAPKWIDFMKGIAEGAKLDYERVLWINVASNLLEGPQWSMRTKMPGCTSICVAPERTDTGKLIIGQNLDWHPELVPTVMRFTPDDGSRVLSFSFAGALPQVGMSEHGYAQVVNAIMLPENKAGVPMNGICAEALFQKSIGFALNTIANAPRAMSFNHLLGSADGLMLDMETYPSGYGALEEENGQIVHTNHFVTPWLQKDDLGKADPDTFTRRRRAIKILNAADKISIETLKTVFSDHAGDPAHSICFHPDPALDFTQVWETVYSVVMVPEDGVAYLSDHPCKNEYQEYSLW